MNKLNESYIGLRKDLLQFINGQGLNVLDVGCAIGVNGDYLKNTGTASWVTGVEYDSDMAIQADKCCDRVFCGDLNDNQFIEEILSDDKTFDVIIFGDILEHLYAPQDVLKKLVSKLTKNGTVIISLPNIRHIELLIQVYLKGTWPKNERGIFDKTHLRWFTYKDVVKMIESCGLQLIEYNPSYRYRDSFNSKSKFILKIIKFFFPKLFIFQHKLLCKKL